MLRLVSPGKRTALLVMMVVLAAGSATVVWSAPRIDQLLDRAYLFASHGLGELAVSQFQEVVKTDDKNVEARLAAGIVLQVNGKDQQAIALWEQADKLGDPAAPSFIGDALLVRGDLDGAEAAYQRALERQPGAVRPTLGLSLVAENRGDLQNAIAKLQALADRSEKAQEVPVTEVMYHLGRLYIKAEQYDKALSVLKKGVLYNSGHAGMQLLLGEAYEKKHASAEAIHAYERALQLDPTSTAASDGLARLRK